MKLKTTLIVSSIIIFGSCSNKQEEKVIQTGIERKAIRKITKGDGELPISFYVTDTTDKAFVKLTTIDKDGPYLIEWGTEKKKWNGNLFELTESQGYRMPPSVKWITEDYICMMTNWTGQFSQHIFLPLKEECKVQFFKEDIEYMDSINLFVVYVEADYRKNKVYWTIQSLVNDKKETFEIPIYDNSLGYPWYEDLELNKDEVLISSQGKRDKVLKIDITEYRTKQLSTNEVH